MGCGHLLASSYRVADILATCPERRRPIWQPRARPRFLRALGSLGHRATLVPGDAGWGLIATVDGIEIPIEMKAASVINPETVARMLASTDKRRKSVARVVVGDLITGPAQRVLRDAGWGWLDRRGHLVLRAKGVYVDADVPPDERPATGAGTDAHLRHRGDLVGGRPPARARGSTLHA